MLKIVCSKELNKLRKGEIRRRGKGLKIKVEISNDCKLQWTIYKIVKG